MRVDANAGPDVLVAIRDRDDVNPLSLTRRNVEKAGDTPRPGGIEDLALALGESLIVEVAMASDQPHAGVFSSSGNSIRGKSGVGAARRKSLSASGEYQWLRIPSKVRSSEFTPIASSRRSALAGITGRIATASTAMQTY